MNATSTSDPLLLIALMVTLGLVPFLAMLVTSYTKIVVVLGLIRQALGVQQVPPNMVINSVALILSLYVMAPVGMDAMATLKPKLSSNAAMKFSDVEGIYTAVATPLKTFLTKHTIERDRQFFVQTAKRVWPAQHAQTLDEKHMLVLIPAFTTSELSKAFLIGFLVYLAFVVVDLVVANILLALGMSMISPTVISVPFKLLLFVALDGWTRLVQGLILSYA
jgi:type III secretion protein R